MPRIRPKPPSRDPPDPWSVTHWVDGYGALIIHLAPASGPEHDLSPDCWCAPTRVDEPTDQGDPSHTYYHNREH